MNLRKTLIQRVAEFGVEDRPLAGRDDGFSSLFYGEKEFAHFHNDNELDLRLTKSIIQREGLKHWPDSVVHPNRKTTSQWIELRFQTPADIDRVVDLIRLTISKL